MKVTNAAISLVSYYIQEEEKVTPTVYKIDNEKELLQILKLGVFFAPAFSLIEYKGKPPSDLQISKFNTVYLCTEDIDSWRELNKDWIEIFTINPELFKAKIDRFKNLFTFDCFDYLWETYKNKPKKILSEVTKIVLANYQRKYSLEDLSITNQNNLNVFLDICNNLGTTDYSKNLFELSESSLRQLFIGSEKKPPYIYYFLVGNKVRRGNYPELWQAVEILKEAVDNKLIPINVAAVLFNQWVSTLKKVRLNYKKYEFQFNYKQLIELESLLKGI